MTASTVDRKWPVLQAETERQLEEATAKYAPLVARLTACELIALSNVVVSAIAQLSIEARSEDIRRGHRPPGTRIGR